MRNALQRILPGWAYDRLIGDWHPEGFKKYAANTGWMFIGRVALYPLSIVVIAAVARYLGPNGLGTLSYAQSIAGIVGTFALLGIDQIIVRDLILQPDRRAEILGTALCIETVSSVIAFLATAIAFFFIDTNSQRFLILLFASATMLTGPFSIGINLFTADAQSKYPTIISLATRSIIALLKLALVFLAAPLVWFASLLLLESIITLCLSQYFLHRVLGVSLRTLRFSLTMAKRLLHDSWPLLISATTVYLFARIDQVLLQHFLGSGAVGYYSAAVQLTEAWTFIPTIVIGSLYPAVAGWYLRDHSVYMRRMRMMAVLCIGIACAVGAGIIIFAPLIVHIVFGPAFRASVPVLRLYTLYVPVAVLYAILQNHLTTSNRTRLMVVIGSAGALVNIGLNIALIPDYGAMGATAATIVAGLVMISIPFIDRTVRPATIRHA